MKKIVTYFSASGTTKALAETMKEALGCDIYEIQPEKKYTQADLDWRDKNSRSSVEMNDKSFRPAIKDIDAGLGEYDVIYVGFPIWWYVAPTHSSKNMILAERRSWFLQHQAEARWETQ